MKTFIQRYYIFFLYIPILVVSFLLFSQNIYKGIFLLLVFTIWFLLSLINRKEYLYTILLILFVLPLNITLQLNGISDPYVGGFFVNYLVPTLSVLDVCISILFVQLTILHTDIFKRVITDKYLLIFFVLLAIHNIFVHNFLTIQLSLRLSVYLLTSILLLNVLLKDRKVLRNAYIKIPINIQILFQGCLGIYQFIKGSSLGLSFLGESNIVNGMLGSSFIDIQGVSYLRAYGTFPHPNVLAGWYILMFFTSIFLYRKSKDKIYIVNIFLILLFIVFTFSRVSIILLSISFFTLLFKYFLKTKKMYSLSSILWYRFLNIFSGEDSSIEDRIKLLKLNIQILKENIFGVGLGQSIQYYKENIPFTQGGKLLLQPVHNIFVLNFVELGFLVGTYYMYIIYRFFLRGIKMNTTTLLLLLCILVIGMFDHYLYSLPQGNAIFFSFLILLSDSRLSYS